MQGLRPLYRYFDFTGRSARAEFWQFVGLVLVAIVLAFLLDSAMGNVQSPVLTLLVIAAMITPGYAVATRRLHDRDWSGKWLVGHAVATLVAYLAFRGAGANPYSATGDIMLALGKLLNWVVRGFVVLFFAQFIRAGNSGDNRFGSPPADDTPAPTFNDVALKVRAQVQPALQSSAPPPPNSASTASRITTPTPDPLAQIERLAKLREAGTLTDDEFQAQKAALLARL